MALYQCLEALAIYENANAHATHTNSTRANDALLPSRINETNATTTTGRVGTSAGSGSNVGERRSSSSSFPEENFMKEEKVEVVAETEVEKALSSSSTSSHGSRVSEGHGLSQGREKLAMDVQQQHLQQQQQHMEGYRYCVRCVSGACMPDCVPCSNFAPICLYFWHWGGPF